MRLGVVERALLRRVDRQETLQPHVVEAFRLTALPASGGQVAERLTRRSRCGLRSIRASGPRGGGPSRREAFRGARFDRVRQLLP